MRLPDVPNLHDATLDRVTVDLSRRTAWIRCTRVRQGALRDPSDPPPRGEVTLAVRAMREVRVDRRDPWGPSDSIKSAYANESSTSEVELYIDMQSGDRIFALGGGLDVQESAT